MKNYYEHTNVDALFGTVIAQYIIVQAELNMEEMENPHKLIDL